MKPRLYSDADITPIVARLLREAGYDAVSCHDIGAQYESDEWHLRHATVEGRVLITYNVKDFIHWATVFAERDEPHAGILASYKQYNNDELGAFLGVLLSFLHDRTAEDLSNVLLFLPRPRLG
jgi:predicted nuclease of predicted toxin-antitoxin system